MIEPLSCTALERFFIEDGRAGSDAMGHMVYELRGITDRHLLAESFRLTSRRHPLLHTRVRFAIGKRIAWEFHDEPNLFFDEFLFLQYFDSSGQLNIEVHSGVKFLVQISQKLTVIHVRFHHAACDGLALIALMKEWIGAYRAMQGGRQPENLKVDLALLAKRGQSRWRLPQRVKLATAAWNFLVEGVRWSFTRCIPITPSNSLLNAYQLGEQRSEFDSSVSVDSNTKANWHHLESSAVTLSEGETERLKYEAMRRGVMLNDLILCVLYFLLRRRTGVCNSNFYSRSDNIRVGIPNSLRKSQDRSLSACNVLGFAFLDRQINADTQFNDLLQSIGRQTREIRRWNGGQMFLDGLSLLQAWPYLFKKILRLDTCLASAIYSSVGQVDQIDRDLVSIRGKPPLRRNTHIAVFSALIGSRLIITLSATPTIFSINQREALLQEFSNELRIQTEGKPVVD